jgi:hypothetical protein
LLLNLNSLRAEKNCAVTTFSPFSAINLKFSKIFRWKSWLLAGLCLLGKSAMAEEASFFERLFSATGWTVKDLDVRPERWDTPKTLPYIENLLKDPTGLMHLPGFSTQEVGTLQSFAALAQKAAQVLDITEEMVSVSSSSSPVQSAELPQPCVMALNRIFAVQERAKVLLLQSIQSLSAEERRAALQAWQRQASDPNATDNPDQDLKQAFAFQEKPLIQAALNLIEVMEAAAPAVMTLNVPTHQRSLRWHTKDGDILFSTSRSAHFTTDDLANVLLLVRIGEKTTYLGEVAAARENQIRLVLDFSSVILVEGTQSPTAGAGLFGIGLMLLPNSASSVTMKTGNFSQGAGLFGVGGLSIAGHARALSSGRFAQGAGAFGLGLLLSHGDNTHLSVEYAGQGCGFTNGVGVVMHRGHHSTLSGGLSLPDARESLAFISLCQGMGYGPRAYAAGGVGLAWIIGDKNRLETSYFGQGSGYWHGLGNCVVIGKDNELQARRYSQGSGIHTAVGTLVLQGDHNKTMNWGVGPAYGWDWGIGALIAEGDENHFQADWATGHGEQNGHAFASIRGDRNELLLPNFATGTLNRNRPSYGGVIIDGQDNRFAWSSSSSPILLSGNFIPNPWGILISSGGLLFDGALEAETVLWPSDDRRPSVEKEKLALQKRLDQATQEPPNKKINEWLRLASYFGLESEVSTQALKNLVALSPTDFPLLLSSLSSDALDDYLRIRFLSALFPHVLSAGVKNELPKATGTRKALLLGLLSNAESKDTLEIIIPATQDTDWRIRKAAIVTLGQQDSREYGSTLGRLRLWELVKEMTQPHAKNVKKFPLEGALGTQTLLGDMMNVLAFDSEMTATLKTDFLSDNAGDLFSPATPATWSRWQDTLQKRAPLYQSLSDQEINAAKRRHSTVRRLLHKALRDVEPEVSLSALIALGQLQDSADIHYLAHEMHASSVTRREAAATALSKYGPEAASILLSRGSKQEVSWRVMLMKVAAQSCEPAIQNLLLKGLADSDAQVRTMALAALNVLEKPPKEFIASVRNQLATLGMNDPDLHVRLQAAQWLKNQTQRDR